MILWIENLSVTIFALASTIFLYKKARINFTCGKNFSILAVVKKIKKKKLQDIKVSTSSESSLVPLTTGPSRTTDSEEQCLVVFFHSNR